MAKHALSEIDVNQPSKRSKYGDEIWEIEDSSDEELMVSAFGLMEAET
jgi:hypothetical protein